MGHLKKNLRDYQRQERLLELHHPGIQENHLSPAAQAGARGSSETRRTTNHQRAYSKVAWLENSDWTHHCGYGTVQNVTVW